MELIITNRKGEAFTVLYDDCDHGLVSSKKWSINPSGYAQCAVKKENGKWTSKKMHRLILGVDDIDIEVDHINHNRRDNRRENIRKCTNRENSLNKSPSGGSKYLGVYTHNLTVKGHRYSYIRACIRIGGKSCFIGTFDTEEDAARHYDKLAKIHHGEFANLNFKE